MNFILIGKYAHLVATGNADPCRGCECLVDFGNVAVSSSAERWIDLKNFSPVHY